MPDRKEPTIKSDEVNIIVTGDFCPHMRIEQLCLNENYQKIYNNALPLLKDKDISITNLECPLSEKESPINKSGPSLIASSKCIEGIKYGGFDVVTLANNHILDHGEGGLKDTLRACKKVGIQTVGVGKNIEEASQPLYIDVKEKSIAILDFAEHEFSIAGKNKSGANPLDLVANYYQIKKAKETADIVLVIIHGGHEEYHLPSPRMVAIYRFFADLGVTAVIGHHTHCVSGYEYHNDVPIFYSLGNFIFDWENINFDSWFEGCFIKLTITNNSVSKLSLYPYYQCKNQPGLMLMNEEDKSTFLRKVEGYSQIISHSNLLEESWIEFCQSRRVDYLSNLLFLNKIKRRMLNRNILSNLIIRKKRLLSLLNMFRCQAHKEVMIKTIENEIFKDM